MHYKTRNRLFFWSLSILSIILGIAVILYNLSDSISFFVTPTILIKENIKSEVKLGGYAKKSSIKKLSIDEIEFLLTDRVSEINVRFKGPIPMIFREDQGIVVTGKLEGDIFKASQLLVKHDEKYMPKNIKEKIK